jgi:gluconate 2-dehydrogenase gamma chain
VSNPSNDGSEKNPAEPPADTSVDHSRRNFFKHAGFVGAGAVIASTPLLGSGDAAAQAKAPGGAVTPEKQPETRKSGGSARQRYAFFNSVEAAFVEASIDRLIPPDPQFPGARDAGVAVYIDRQLAGAYGAGARIYMQGPWKQGTPSQGYQLPFTPSKLYRIAIADIDDHVKHKFGGRSFQKLNDDEQDGVLRDLESGAAELPNVPSAVFFETLLANTIEGFFADPVYGGNRDMAAWKMIGFPGAYAAYINEVDQHGIDVVRAPLSVASGADHDHGGMHDGGHGQQQNRKQG